MFFPQKFSYIVLHSLTMQGTKKDIKRTKPGKSYIGGLFSSSVMWLFDFLNHHEFEFFKNFRIKEPPILAILESSMN